MNTLQGSIRERAEAFISSLPYSNKDHWRSVFDTLIQKVASHSGLTAHDLRIGTPHSDKTREFVLMVNEMSGKLSAMSDDASIVQTVADLVYTLVHDKPFGEASESLSLLLSNYILRSA